MSEADTDTTEADEARVVWEAFATAGRRRRYLQDAALFLEGDPPGTVFAILSGDVRIVASSPEGDTTLTVCGPGQLLGEVSAIDGMPRSASAIAATDVDVATLPSAEFNRMLEEQPALALRVMRLLAARLRRSTGERVLHSHGDAITIIAAGLVAATEQAGVPVGTVVHVPVGAAELADHVGGDYEVTSQALAGLAGEGWIEQRADGIYVLNLPALRRLAADAPLRSW